MKTDLFKIYYQGQTLEVERTNDANKQTYYKVKFPHGEELELYLTPEFEGMAQSWAEGTGEKTDTAREIGNLIEKQV